MAIKIIIDTDVGKGLEITDTKLCPNTDNTSVEVNPNTQEIQAVTTFGEPRTVEANGLLLEVKTVNNTDTEVVTGAYVAAAEPKITSYIPNVEITEVYTKLFGKGVSEGKLENGSIVPLTYEPKTIRMTYEELFTAPNVAFEGSNIRVSGDVAINLNTEGQKEVYLTDVFVLSNEQFTWNNLSDLISIKNSTGKLIRHFDSKEILEERSIYQKDPTYSELRYKLIPNINNTTILHSENSTVHYQFPTGEVLILTDIPEITPSGTYTPPPKIENRLRTTQYDYVTVSIDDDELIKDWLSELFSISREEVVPVGTVSSNVLVTYDLTHYLVKLPLNTLVDVLFPTDSETKSEVGHYFEGELTHGTFSFH